MVHVPAPSKISSVPWKTLEGVFFFFKCFPRGDKKRLEEITVCSVGGLTAEEAETHQLGSGIALMFGAYGAPGQGPNGQIPVQRPGALRVTTQTSKMAC